MNKTDFWKTLKEVHNRKPFVMDDLFIRQTKTEDCPVVAVARAITKKRALDCCDHVAAAELIDLDTEFAEDIADAADGRIFDRISGECLVDKYRNKMLKMFKLEEQDPEAAFERL